jgi:AraC-like DNA-binding protein
MLRVQIEQAKRLLCDTNLALKVVAHRVGFSSEQYFSDAFHPYCGVRPIAFRRLKARGSLIAQQPDNGA